MQKSSFVPTWLAAIAISGLVAGCGDDPVIKNPTAPTGPSASSLEISGPASVAPGQSAQFTAVVRLSDGTTRGFTPATHVVWRSSNTSMLQVAGDSGRVIGGQERGEVTISAELATPTGVTRATKDLVILPDGTYRVTGRVVDAEFPTFNIENARVEFTPGSVIALTDSHGSYRAYGVPPNATMRVTADGYQEYRQSIQLAAHGSQHVQLTPSGPRPSLNGNYTLALDVTDACKPGGTIPALAMELRHRTYEVVLTQNGSAVDVKLTEPRFRLEYGTGNHFSGTVTENRATFTIEFGWEYGGYADVVEQLSNNTFLIPVGTAVVTLVPGGLVSGQMSGSPTTGFTALMNADSRFPELGFALVGGCFGSVRFTLTPR